MELKKTTIKYDISGENAPYIQKLSDDVFTLEIGCLFYIQVNGKTLACMDYDNDILTVLHPQFTTYEEKILNNFKAYYCGIDD